jgi:hypothetical protein
MPSAYPDCVIPATVDTTAPGRVIFRITLLPVSAINKLPKESNANCFGKLNAAVVPTPSMYLRPLIPATIDAPPSAYKAQIWEQS